VVEAAVAAQVLPQVLGLLVVSRTCLMRVCLCCSVGLRRRSDALRVRAWTCRELTRRVT